MRNEVLSELRLVSFSFFRLLWCMVNSVKPTTDFRENIILIYRTGYLKHSTYITHYVLVCTEHNNNIITK